MNTLMSYQSVLLNGIKSKLDGYGVVDLCKEYEKLYGFYCHEYTLPSGGKIFSFDDDHDTYNHLNSLNTPFTFEK